MKLAKIALLIVLFLVFTIGSIQVYNCKNVCTQQGIIFTQPVNITIIGEGGPIPLKNTNGIGLLKGQSILIRDEITPFRIGCLEEYP